MSTDRSKLGIAGLIFSTMALPANADTLVEKLQMFRNYTLDFMTNQKSVQKFELQYQIEKDKMGRTISEKIISETPIPINPRRGNSKFLPEDIKSGDFVLQKNAYHEGVQKTAENLEHWRETLHHRGRAQIDNTVDNPATLVEKGLVLTHLEQMESFKGKSYTSASLQESPWSGDYWAIYAGVIAKRYNDPEFKKIASNNDWSSVKAYIETQNNKQDAFNSSSIHLLSPAEKYDLLIGDKNMSLTKAMLNEGQKYFSENQKVATWMGICHGWAPASFMEMRPSHDVEVMAADGTTKITFYPSDIKALASLLWAQTKTPSNFIGTRCNTKDPQMDENGRVIDPSCFDTNPGTWHLAVVNQLGYYGKSFVLDATFDYEVWNQPAYSYEYSYFNPSTGTPVATLAEAKVKTSYSLGGDGQEHQTFTGDKFTKYRSKNAKEIVGIAMKFIYIAETAPSTAQKDSQSLDRRVAVNYLYDLELDENGKIIGGEWYQKQHPDFLWSPPENTKALSRGDSALSAPGYEDHSHWKKRHAQPAPHAWIQAAKDESSPVGQPLARIVKELIQKSNQVDIDLGMLGKRHWNTPSSGQKERY